jgi:hypothetical protein
MKRQQLEKMIGKKIAGGYGDGRRKSRGSKTQAQSAAQGKDEAKVPIAVRLIKGLERK